MTKNYTRSFIFTLVFFVTNIITPTGPDPEGNERETCAAQLLELSNQPGPQQAVQQTSLKRPRESETVTTVNDKDYPYTKIGLSKLLVQHRRTPETWTRITRHMFEIYNPSTRRTVSQGNLKGLLLFGNYDSYEPKQDLDPQAMLMHPVNTLLVAATGHNFCAHLGNHFESRENKFNHKTHSIFPVTKEFVSMWQEWFRDNPTKDWMDALQKTSSEPTAKRFKLSKSQTARPNRVTKLPSILQSTEPQTDHHEG